MASTVTVLAEFYESGNAPHEALGRAARRLSSGGAVYLGGGVGVEKQQTPKGELYHLTGGGPKTETFAGPLSAMIRAFTIAGAKTTPDSPGGETAVSDPAAAARLRELKDEEAEANADIARFEARLKRRQAQQSAGKGLPWSPVRADDDAWEQRRIEELRADLGRIRAERAKLLASGTVEEVEQARPGTNFTKIPPKNVAKLKGIIDHYRGMAHPFTACVRDQVKHGLSQDHANRRCAVVKDLATGTTKWRVGGKKKDKVAEALLLAALGRLDVIEQEFGLAALVSLVESDLAGAPPAIRQLAEGVGNDFGLLSLAGHPLAMATFGLSEDFNPDQPRDFFGRWKKTVGALKVGDSAKLPDGTEVKRTRETTFEVHGRMRVGDLATSAKHRAQLEREGTPHSRLAAVPSSDKAALLGVQKSVQSNDPKSLGGATKYPSAKAWLDGGELAKSQSAGQKAQATRDEIERKSPGAGRAAADRADALSGRAGPTTPPGGRSQTAADRAARKPGEVAMPSTDSSLNRMRNTLRELPKGQRYSVVNGRGNPVGHVEKTEGGYEVVLPSGIRTHVTAGAAALVVDKFERQAKANETARQRTRRENIDRMEARKPKRGRTRLREGDEGVLGALLDERA